MERDNRTILTVMKQQAWARAKGELDTVLNAFVGEQVQFEKTERTINEFIKDVESNLF